MVRRLLGHWTIEFDPDATRRCVAQLPSGAGCTCLGCRNFDAAAGRNFPAPFIELAESLGLDVRRPSEVYHCYLQEPSGLYDLAGWFNLVGSVTAGGDGWCGPDGAAAPRPEPMVPAFRFQLGRAVAPVPSVFIGSPVVELSFYTHVPWVLAESPVE